MCRYSTYFWPRLFTIQLLGVLPLLGTSPQGIPRSLARERAAEVSNIEYDLRFTLIPRASTIAGEEKIRFMLREAKPLLLDYRDGTLNALTVNGGSVPIEPENGHVEFPARLLLAGENVMTARFASNVAPAGKAFTRYEDRTDNSEYIYTLFVPMDASMAFPCFDQPDLKGRFRLEVNAPVSWTVISNTAARSSSLTSPEQRHTVFQRTLPISTYLFAFAAGPFRELRGGPGEPGLYVRKSMFKRAETEAPEVQQIAAEGIQYLSKYFAQPFPFPKYDMILIPEFPYGGMEHAGATFLREEAVLFRRAPTHNDLLGRDLVVLHELTHQWFGDLVTMRWFDDLWLKEGFAQYMAYQMLASLKPNENIWKRFYESIKPAAYDIDSTQGTTPIYQDIANLKDAKSAYGAIVYSKAPAVLKQLAYVLGPRDFRNGLRLYLKDHVYANAEWSDLVKALESSSGRDLAPWAEMWIRHRGMPQVDVAWSCHGDRLSGLSLSQHDVLGTDSIWPIATQVALHASNGNTNILRVEMNQRALNVSAAAGKPCPQFVFANDQDYAYGRFLLDKKSQAFVMARLGQIHDLFLRTLLWGSLWDSVREADLAPSAFLSLAAKSLPDEKDETLVESLLGHTATALHRYVSDRTRSEFVPRFETMSADRMLHAPDQSLRIAWFRGLRAIAETSQGRATLKALLDGQISIPGVELRPLDRWSMVTALIALGDPQASAVFDAERRRDNSGETQKYLYISQAARPNAETKQKYFDDYLHNASRSEDWIEQSLGAFNYWNQSALTGPYLKPALEALPQIKRDRKIFFLVAWLTAFIDGQQSPAAQAQVDAYLRTANLDEDLRLKILQAKDELDRTVKIRGKFPD